MNEGKEGSLIDICNIEKVDKLYHSSWDEIEDMLNKNNLLSLNHFPTINRKIGGLNKGELIVVGARTSNGKSAFCLSLALDLALQGRKIHFFSLEMTKTSCMKRLISNILNIDPKSLFNREFVESEECADKRNTGYDIFKKMNWTFSDSIGKTFPEIQFIIQNLKELDVVFIDYIQMIKGVNPTMKESIDEYVKGLRSLAIKKNITIVLASQINRAGAGERLPQLHELKSTGCLEEICDKAILLNYPYFYDKTISEDKKNILEVQLAKNRGGETFSLDTFFIPEYSKIMEREVYNARFKK